MALEPYGGEPAPPYQLVALGSARRQALHDDTPDASINRQSQAVDMLREPLLPRDGDVSPAKGRAQRPVQAHLG